MSTPTTVQVKIQLRRDTSANWTSVNPVLLAGEMGLETNTNRIKVGNGSTAWNSLGYFPFVISGGTVTGDLEIGTTGTLRFEGSSADNFETTLGVINPTADRTINLPNVSGTIITTGDTGTVTSTMIADGTIVNADVSASAAIAHSKLATITAGYVLIGNASNVPTATQVTGDVTISDTGVTAISSGVIVDADVSATAEIAVSKLANGTANQVIVTDGTNVSWSDDLTLAGNLTVNGTTTTINTQDLLVEDKNIIIGNVTTPSDVTADGGGVTLKGATDKTITWVDATDAWTSSERFSVPLGSAASPSLTFTGDENTGIYSPGADQVAISTNGTGRLFVNSDGTVSVGNTLTFSGATSLGLRASTNTAVGNLLVLQKSNDGTNPANIAFCKSRGTASSPTAVLSEDVSAAFFGLAFDGTTYQSIGGIKYVVEGIAGTNDVSGYITLDTRPSGVGAFTQERLRITSAGLVGVGTSSPGTYLDTRGFASYRGNAYTIASFCANNTLAPLNICQSENGTAPAISAGQNSTGTYQPLVLMTSELKRVLIDSSGNVGIGTTSPASRLDVAGYTKIGNYTGTFQGLSLQNNNDSSSAETVSFLDSLNNLGTIDSNLFFGHQTDGASYISLGTTPAGSRSSDRRQERLRITGSGNVGIGTTSPSALLHLNAVAPALLIARSSAASTPSATGLQLSIDGTTYGKIYATASGGIGFAGPSSDYGTFDTSGRLLVGTPTSYATRNYLNNALEPQQQLHGITSATTTSAVTNWSNTTQGPAQLVLAKSKGGTLGTRGIVANNDDIGVLAFTADDGTNFIPAASILAEVDGTPGADDMPGRIVLSTTASGASSPTERMRIDKGGSIFFAGITSLGQISGATANGKSILGPTGSAILDSSRIETTGAVHLRFYNPNGQVGSIQTSGTSTSYITSSDHRLKENVTPVTDGITRLQQLKPSRFNFIADPDTTVDGFIAHEVQDIVPEAISGDKDAVDENGDPVYQGIDQSKLVPLLTAALQEAVAKIESLEARLTAAGL